MENFVFFGSAGRQQMTDLSSRGTAQVNCVQFIGRKSFAIACETRITQVDSRKPDGIVHANKAQAGDEAAVEHVLNLSRVTNTFFANFAREN